MLRQIVSKCRDVVCEYDGYCRSRLNVSMHLLISLAQKNIQY